VYMLARLLLGGTFLPSSYLIVFARCMALNGDHGPKKFYAGTGFDGGEALHGP
jgi:hypothetical protein